MNPDTNKFEMLMSESDSNADCSPQEQMDQRVRDLRRALSGQSRLVRPDGSPVPEHWTVLTVGELVTVKSYTFKVAHIGESHLLLEPTGPVVVGDDE